MTDRSQGQQIALAICPKVSSVLSLIGSSWITAEVLTGTDPSSGQPKYRHPYHRLLLGMCLYDILESIFNFFSTWALPKETENVWMPLGNQKTCSTQGFFIAMSTCVPMYNAFISIYYLLVIRFNFSDSQIKKRIEPMMHVIAAIWSFGTSITAVSMGLINNSNLWCWIAPLPLDCKDSRRHGDDANCERGDNAWIYRWAFFFAMLWLCLLVATVCTTLVAFHVYKIDQMSLKYRKPQLRQSLVSYGSQSSLAFANSQELNQSTMPQSEPTTTTFANSENNHSRDGSSGDIVLAQECAREEDNDNNGDEKSSRSFKRSLIESLPRPDKRVSSWRHSRQQFKENNPRTVEVFWQAVYYLLSFYMTYGWSFINRLLQQILGHTFFGLIVLMSFFDPLQGFLTFFVYQRPRFIKERKENPHLSRWQCLRNILRLTKFGPPPSRKSTTNGSSRERKASSDFNDDSSMGQRFDRRQLPNRTQLRPPASHSINLDTVNEEDVAMVGGAPLNVHDRIGEDEEEIVFVEDEGCATNEDVSQDGLPLRENEHQNELPPREEEQPEVVEQEDKHNHNDAPEQQEEGEVEESSCNQEHVVVVVDEDHIRLEAETHPRQQQNTAKADKSDEVDPGEHQREGDEGRLSQQPTGTDVLENSNEEITHDC